MKQVIRLIAFIAFIAAISFCSACTEVTVISCPTGDHDDVCTCGDPQVPAPYPGPPVDGPGVAGPGGEPDPFGNGGPQVVDP